MEGSRTVKLQVSKADNGKVTLEDSKGYAMEVIQAMCEIFANNEKIVLADVVFHTVPCDEDDLPLRSLEVTIPNDPVSKVNFIIQQEEISYGNELQPGINATGLLVKDIYMEIFIKKLKNHDFKDEDAIDQWRQKARRYAKMAMRGEIDIKEFRPKIEEI